MDFETAKTSIEKCRNLMKELKSSVEDIRD